MTPCEAYDPLEAGKLSDQIDSAMSCLNRMGPYVANVQVSPSFRAVIVSLLENVERFLPDPDPLEIKSEKGQVLTPSVLARQAQQCWELAFPLDLGRAALSRLLAASRGQFGFGPRNK